MRIRVVFNYFIKNNSWFRAPSLCRKGKVKFLDKEEKSTINGQKNFLVSKSIIITEKPSVGRAYANALNVHSSEKTDGYIENDSYIITWCIGHLIEMLYPEKYDEKYKKWTLEDLPFLPKNYMYGVISSVSKQFNIIKQIYHRSDVSRIYYAGDAGREGIYIQMLVRQEAGLREGIEEKVVWIDSPTNDEIRRGIREAKPLSAYKNMSDSGYMRALEDYALGINFSRALSVRYSNILFPSNRAPIAVGRVMSCVLGMVVEKEREILNFKATPFYKIISHINVNGADIAGTWHVDKNSPLMESGRLYNETGFKTRNDAEAFIGSLSNSLKIASVSDTLEKKSAPLLYNLAELQADCSKKLKISPDETLEIVQSLYEKKMVTYPRTDARVLSTAIADEIERNVRNLSDYSGEAGSYVGEILASGSVQKIRNTRYTDDSQITDHYAIIPTGENLSSVHSLCEEEKAVFDMIVRRFLSIFMPPAVYRKVKITEEDMERKEHFYITGSALEDPGYLKIAGIPENKEGLKEEVLSVKEGNTFNGTFSIEEGETKPPKRYTSGSMVLAMENAGQLIEDEELRATIKKNGIGTSATRAETIKKLVKIGYLNLNKKTQVLTPGNMGNKVYEVLSLTAPELLNPKITASWEKGLTAVAEGRVSADEYREKLEAYIRKGIDSVKKADIKDELVKRIAPYMSKENAKPQKFKVNAECYLNVPFEEKEKVQKLGAWFDGERKAWYVPKGKDTAPFEKWRIEGVPKKPGKNIYIYVPYDEKDDAKKLGARWDKEKKLFYIPGTIDPKPFEKWRKKQTCSKK